MKLNSIRIKNGDGEIRLNDITVLVGPNNVGKSQTLRDIKNILELGKNAKPVIINEANFDFPQDFDAFLKLLNTTESTKTAGNKTIRGLKSDMLNDDTIDFPIEPYRIAYDNIERRNNEILGKFTKWFVTDLSSSNRLKLASSVNAVNPELNNPTNLLQSLYLDDSHDPILQRAFKDAFDMDIALDYSAMVKFCFRVAKEMPDIPDDPRKAYHITNQLGKIEDQGDGFRSFVGIILGLLFSKGRIILLDEPEAFLHPAQARFLGKWIGEHKELIEGQLIISTHNANFLSGIIASAAHIDIYRLNRHDDNTSYNLIPSEATKLLFEHPLLSSQRVIESVFYRGVVVCEADADRAIYQGVASINHNSNEDVLFIHSQNKQTLHIVSKLLCNANIPVALIADIDALNDEKVINDMITSTSEGPVPQNIIDLRKYIASTVNGGTDEELLELLTMEIDTLNTQLQQKGHSFSGAKSAIERIQKSIKPWNKIKTEGIDGFEEHVKDRVNELIYELKKYRIFIVPVGELEGWLEVGTRKKNKWIIPALELIHQGNASPLLIKFVGEILEVFK